MHIGIPSLERDLINYENHTQNTKANKLKIIIML